MKLTSFSVGDRRHIGCMLDDQQALVDLTEDGEPALFRDMLAMIDGGERALDLARTLFRRRQTVHAVDSVQLLAPVPVPRQLFDCLCFEQHWVQASKNAHLTLGGEPRNPQGAPMPSVFREMPVYYKGNRFSVVGTGADIICPRYSHKLDYELEFGVFLGKSLKNASLEEAASAIFGYCIFNDVSARDRQISEMRGGLGPSKGKDFDTGNVMGPWLVTADEITNPRDLTMSAYINGEHVSSGSSGGMLWSFPEIIAYSSMDETRHAGEFFGSGTVGGGCGLETGRLLEHGDVLELEISQLGRLRNRIVIPHAS